MSAAGRAGSAPADPSRYCLGLVTLAIQAADPPGPGQVYESPRSKARRLLVVDGPSYGLGPADRDLLMGLANSLTVNPGDYRRLKEVLG